jgi:hypothetical protein
MCLFKSYARLGRTTTLLSPYTSRKKPRAYDLLKTMGVEYCAPCLFLPNQSLIRIMEIRLDSLNHSRWLDFGVSLNLGHTSTHDDLIKDYDMDGRGLFTFKLSGSTLSLLKLCWFRPIFCNIFVLYWELVKTSRFSSFKRLRSFTNHTQHIILKIKGIED